MDCGRDSEAEASSLGEDAGGHRGEIIVGGTDAYGTCDHRVVGVLCESLSDDVRNFDVWGVAVADSGPEHLCRGVVVVAPDNCAEATRSPVGVRMRVVPPDDASENHQLALFTVDEIFHGRRQWAQIGAVADVKSLLLHCGNLLEKDNFLILKSILFIFGFFSESSNLAICPLDERIVQSGIVLDVVSDDFAGYFDPALVVRTYLDASQQSGEDFTTLRFGVILWIVTEYHAYLDEIYQNNWIVIENELLKGIATGRQISTDVAPRDVLLDHVEQLGKILVIQFPLENQLTQSRPDLGEEMTNFVERKHLEDR